MMESDILDIEADEYERAHFTRLETSPSNGLSRAQIDAMHQLDEFARCKDAALDGFVSRSSDSELIASIYCTDCPVKDACITLIDPRRSLFDGIAGGIVWMNGRIAGESATELDRYTIRDRNLRVNPVDWYTVDQLMDLTGRSRASVLALMNRTPALKVGRVRQKHVGRYTTFYSRSAWDQWMIDHVEENAGDLARPVCPKHNFQMRRRADRSAGWTCFRCRKEREESK